MSDNGFSGSDSAAPPSWQGPGPAGAGSAHPPYANPPGATYPGTSPYQAPPANAVVSGYAAPAQPGPGYAAPGYGAPGYGTPVYPQARTTNGLAVTAMVCGIAGLVLGIFIAPLLASVAAVITGHMALSQLKRDPAVNGRGMAITGLILGYVGLAFIGLLILGWVVSMLFIGSIGFLPFFLAAA